MGWGSGASAERTQERASASPLLHTPAPASSMVHDRRGSASQSGVDHDASARAQQLELANRGGVRRR
jgi:hypothetical protein